MQTLNPIQFPIPCFFPGTGFARAPDPEIPPEGVCAPYNTSVSYKQNTIRKLVYNWWNFFVILTEYHDASYVTKDFVSVYTMRAESDVGDGVATCCIVFLDKFQHSGVL